MDAGDAGGTRPNAESAVRRTVGGVALSGNGRLGSWAPVLAKEFRCRFGVRMIGHTSFLKHDIEFPAAQKQPPLGPLVGIHHHKPCFPAMLKSLGKHDLVSAVHVPVRGYNTDQ